MPMTIGASASTTAIGSEPSVPIGSSRRPPTHNRTLACETRIAPWRPMKAPETRLVAAPPA